MTGASKIVRNRVAALGIICASVLAGCSFDGFLPYDAGPHYIAPEKLGRIVNAQARDHGVPPSLLNAVIDQESGGDPAAISEAGAMGLMQLMPGTAAEYGANSPFDPQENVAAGAAYLSDLLRAYRGNVSLALAAYNAGPGAVAHYRGIPPYAETQAYVKSVSAMYRAKRPGR